MKNLLVTFLMAAVLLVASHAFAFSVPTPTGYVTDAAGALATSQVIALNRRLTDYQSSTKNEIAVLLVSTLEGGNIEDVTHQVFQTYKIGQAGLDNGVLLLVAIKDHKMRLQTGKGIEGEITDIQANDILNSMKPAFRKGNFYAGLNLAVDQIQTKLDARNGQKADPGVGQQFNQPVPQAPPVSNRSASCSVSDVGNDVGFGFGLLAFFVAAIAIARRLVRKNEERKIAELEAKVDAEIAAEHLAAQEIQDRLNRQSQYEDHLKTEYVKMYDQSLKNKTVPQKISNFVSPALVTDAKISEFKTPSPREFTDRAANEARETARQEAERRAEERLAKRQEAELERARANRVAERKLEEHREAARKAQDEETSTYVAPSYSSSESNSNSGFGGGDSGGGGSSSSWDSGSSSSDSSSSDSGSSDSGGSNSDW